jgi:hypothetical protein
VSLQVHRVDFGRLEQKIKRRRSRLLGPAVVLLLHGGRLLLNGNVHSGPHLLQLVLVVGVVRVGGVDEVEASSALLPYPESSWLADGTTCCYAHLSSRDAPSEPRLPMWEAVLSTSSRIAGGAGRRPSVASSRWFQARPTVHQPIHEGLAVLRHVDRRGEKDFPEAQVTSHGMLDI